MSSTGCSIGYDVDRTTSRVLKPPGGGSSDIFGGDAEPVSRKKTDYQKSNIFSDEAPADHSCRGTNARSKEKWTSHVFDESDKKEVTTGDETIHIDAAESPKDNQGSKTGVYNPITGDAYKNKGAEQQRVTTRVTAPPGGRSSGPLW